MQIDFTGTRVLVTGGTRGIGRAIARAFLDNGALVAVNGRDAASVDRALAAMPEALGAPGDVGSVAGCEAAVAAALNLLGGLDVLVNCAGIGIDGPIPEVTEAVWDATIDINLKGTFFCSKAALPALRAAKGNIVNLASDFGLIGSAGSVVYCASKGGVVNMTKAMALEAAPDVRVNCVCPGYIDTDMVRAGYIEHAADPAATEQALIDYAPLRRIAEPIEVAHAVLYLASREARFATGTTLQLDGGTTAGH